MASLHLVVRGRVQGVGFRWFVRETARRVGLAGWVYNRPDGDVELAAEGDDESIELLRSAVRTGPSGADVQEVHELDPPEIGVLTKPFSVRK
jgi:acylphosphatase